MSGLVIAAVTAASLFLTQFGGTWSCGNAQYHAAWTIAQAPGKSAWTSVTYGDPKNPGGTAYVGWLPQQQRYVYRDFHSDGSYAELSAPTPSNGTWTWTGDYYPAGGSKDDGPLITWRLAPDGSIERHFSKRTGTTVEERGSDRCTRTTLTSP